MCKSLLVFHCTIGKLEYGFLFHSNYGRIYSLFDIIHEHDGQTPHDVIGRPNACIVRQKVISRTRDIITPLGYYVMSSLGGKT